MCSESVWKALRQKTFLFKQREMSIYLKDGKVMKKHIYSNCSFLMVTLLVILNGVAAGGTVAHWEFEEGVAGSTAQSPDSIIDSANAMNGTPIGGPVYVETADIYGSMGLHFDGINDYISIEDDPLFAVTNSLTLEAIIVFEGVSPGSRFFNQIVFRGDDRGGHDPYFLAVTLDGRLAFAVGNADNQISVLSASSPLVTGEVLHVAGTLNDVTGEQKLYINASEVASTTTDIRPFATLDSGFDPGLGIGNTQNSDWDQWFNGTIDQVRISDQALIPNEFLPEPATLLLLGLGGLMLRKRHRR